MNKTVSGKENLYFEMESKAQNCEQAYDVVIGESISPATKQTTFEKQGTEHNKQASMQPAHPCTQSDGLVVQRLLCIITAVVVVSFLTAAATLVLALMLMMSRNNPTASTDCVTVQGEPGIPHLSTIGVVVVELSANKPKQREIMVKYIRRGFHLLSFRCSALIRLGIQLTSNNKANILRNRT